MAINFAIHSRRRYYVLKKVIYRKRDVTYRFRSSDLQLKYHRAGDFLSDIFVTGSPIEFVWWENNNPQFLVSSKIWLEKITNPILPTAFSPLYYYGSWTTNPTNQEENQPLLGG